MQLVLSELSSMIDEVIPVPIQLYFTWYNHCIIVSLKSTFVSYNPPKKINALT